MISQEKHSSGIYDYTPIPSHDLEHSVWSYTIWIVGGRARADLAEWLADHNRV